MAFSSAGAVNQTVNGFGGEFPCPGRNLFGIASWSFFTARKCQLYEAPDGFGAGHRRRVLFDPTVQRFKLSRLEADHDALAAPSR
jgi:hypothetical protein